MVAVTMLATDTPTPMPTLSPRRLDSVSDDGDDDASMEFVAAIFV